MAVYTTELIFYESFRDYLGEKVIDLSSGTFKIMLLTSAYTVTQATDDVKADIVANEVANGNGYLTGGITLDTPTWVRTAATVLFDNGTDPVWTATGAGFTSRYYAIYDDSVTTPVIDPLICYGRITGADTDVVLTAPNTLTIAAASGWFDLTTP